jgi:single-strand DNA-binding protein
MIDINSVWLIGRLTRDSELKVLASGQAVCKFSIAVNRRKKSGEQWVDEPNFFDIILWGKQGEVLSQYLVKGKQVAIDGELRQDRWEQDGQNRSKIEIIANNVQLLGGGQGQGGQASSGQGGYGGGQGGGYGQGGGQSGGYGGRSGGYGGGQGGYSQGGAAPTDAAFTDDVPF